LKEKIATPVKKQIYGRGSSAVLTTRHPSISAKVGTKIGRPVAVAQSVEFTCGIKVTESCYSIKRTLALTEDEWDTIAATLRNFSRKYPGHLAQESRV
jgi:hypothetical protein